MNWFARAVKRKLKRRGFRVAESDNFAFDFIATNRKGEKIGVKCQAHGHVYAPQKKGLLSFGIPVYVASEKYGTDPKTHDIKIEEVK